MSHYSDNDYASLKSSLVERLKDKEAPVRVQAVVALSKLQNPDELDDLADHDEENDSDEDEDNPTRMLLEIMKHDPSACVTKDIPHKCDQILVLIRSSLYPTGKFVV